MKAAGTTKPRTRRLGGGYLAAALFAALVLCPRARAWWDGDWALRKRITVDTSAAGVAIGGPIGDVPVLIRLHDGDFQFVNAKSDGTDIRFVADDDKTLLPFHIEKFDGLLNEAFVWVGLKDVKPGSKVTFWMYYANQGPKAVKADNTRDTYDADTVLVYHFSEHGAAPFDFTGRGANALNAGVPSDASIIGTGLRLDGRTAVTVPSAGQLSWSDGGAVTISAWVKFGAPQSNAILISRREGDRFFLLGADAGVPFAAAGSGGGAIRTPGGAPVAPNSWHHVAFVASPGRLTLYVDGDSYGSSSGSLPGLGGPLTIGGDGSVVNGGTGFVGEMDELNVSRTARQPGFVKFEAVEQGPDGSSRLVTLGEDEQPSSIFGFLKKGYVGVIVGSLTVDGWVVICLLAVMGLVSWLVMINKAIYLNKVGKGNADFLKEWRRVASDLSSIDTPSAEAAEKADPAKSGGSKRARRSAARYSPLYHVYQIGIEEIQHRVGGDEGRGDSVRTAISARSIEAIRASLDGGLVRETQKLNSQMVLLTIAISGGPFLGLLGTVVGVMITFAAVAQAGDVNVNAIAPGIAAALAATVAGLAVAIPALFGYNYLLSRVKSASSDMQVFIDEFITKLAEYYSDDGE